MAPSRAKGGMINNSVFIEDNARDSTMLRCAVISYSGEWEDAGQGGDVP